MRMNIAAGLALVLPATAGCIVISAAIFQDALSLGQTWLDISSTPLERAFPVGTRIAAGLVGTWLVAKAAKGVVRAWRSARRERARSEEVVRSLAALAPGEAKGHVFQGRIRGREARIELVDSKLQAGRYEIEVDSTADMPLRASIPGIASLDRLAEHARAGAARGEPRLRALADSLVESREAWSLLFRVFHVESVRFAVGKIRAAAPPGAGLSAPDEAERVLRLVERLIAVTGVVGSILAVEARASALERCPYCHDDLASGEIAACCACGTMHHDDCFAEHGRCAVFACGGEIKDGPSQLVEARVLRGLAGSSRIATSCRRASRRTARRVFQRAVT